MSSNPIAAENLAQARAGQPPAGSEPAGGLAAIEAQVDGAAELWGIKVKKIVR